MDFCQYEKLTGKVLANSACSESASLSLRNDEEVGLIEGFVDGNLKYFVDDVAVDRPVIVPTISSSTIAADGIEECIISNIPANFKIFIDNQFFGTSDGTDIAFTFDLDGTYTIRFVGFPEMPLEVTIDAN